MEITIKSNPIFKPVHHCRKRYVVMKGSAGSGKSVDTAQMYILRLMSDKGRNLVCVRKSDITNRDSTFAELESAIYRMGVESAWRTTQSPMSFTCANGNKIIFRGVNDNKQREKLKSITFAQGKLTDVWIEEATELAQQDLEIIDDRLRGELPEGLFYQIKMTFNPVSSSHWIKKVFFDYADTDVFTHHSTYLDVPAAWLGADFIREAEHLKKTKPELYAHEYLGEVTGTGGEVFTNITMRRIADDEIAAFDRIKRGIDFGYASDPFAYIVGHYDRTRRRLYIFDEIYQAGLSNRRAAEMINGKYAYSQMIICDSAEPKSIAELRGYGLRVRGAKKGPDSIEYGIKFLQSLEEIIIDSVRCPNTAKEFYNYSLEPDNNDGFKAEYPDKDNHTIDAARYALEDEITSKKARIIERRRLGL